MELKGRKNNTRQPQLGVKDTKIPIHGELSSSRSSGFAFARGGLCTCLPQASQQLRDTGGPRMF